jgi:hypothetical protein
MAEPERMADLVDIGLEGIGVEPRAVSGKPVGADVDVRGDDEIARASDAGIGARLVVVESDLRAAGNFREGNAEHVGPQA